MITTLVCCISQLWLFSVSLDVFFESNDIWSPIVTNNESHCVLWAAGSFVVSKHVEFLVEDVLINVFKVILAVFEHPAICPSESISLQKLLVEWFG